MDLASLLLELEPDEKFEIFVREREVNFRLSSCSWIGTYACQQLVSKDLLAEAKHPDEVIKATVRQLLKSVREGVSDAIEELKAKE